MCSFSQSTFKLIIGIKEETIAIEAIEVLLGKYISK